VRVSNENSPEKCGASPKEYQNKAFPVEQADAILSPNAVVVHVEDASFAFRTVVRPFRLDNIAQIAFS
jgi:hypothetical protein